jgi:hypothetical protein
MDLLRFAPDIQEQAFEMPIVEAGADAVCKKHVRAIIAVPD